MGVDLSGGSGGTIYWKSSGAMLPTVKGGLVNSPMDLAHEMFHGRDANRGLMDDREYEGIERNDWSAVYSENILRGQLGIQLRTHYKTAIDPSGKYIGGTGARMLTPANQPYKPIYPILRRPLATSY